MNAEPIWDKLIHPITMKDYIRRNEMKKDRDRAISKKNKWNKQLKK